ncbi:thrombospondin type 3 repeat-containing protein [Nannocystis pusilla]|uniref:thrombospondin type 3 repeat-containing protein n=1 Tax=Nannocystis pusilla TaxID=889268 RepID=UPI003B818D7F
MQAPTVFIVRALSRHLGCLLALAGVSLATTEAWARPTGPRAFCETYADAPECMGRSITCNKCHLSTQPVAWNAYGGAVFAALKGAEFDAGIASALRSIEDEDSDGDGLSNREEIELGTDPGDPLSQWMPRPTPEGPRTRATRSASTTRPSPTSACTCSSAAPPSYEQTKKFAEQGGGTQLQAIHDALAECLESDFWIDEALTSLAHPKIRPVKALGADTDVLISGYKITLADYQWDYRLWQYLLSGDRDARELLTAQYHISRDDAGNWKKVDGIISNPPMGFGGGQLLAPEHRAGMLTTQWNLLLNIMFAAVPASRPGTPTANTSGSTCR